MQRILRIKQRRSILRTPVIQSIELLPRARCFAALCMTGLYRYFGTSLLYSLERQMSMTGLE